MPLTLALGLAKACAPAVAPETLLSVARAESHLDPLVIGVNGRPRQVLHPSSPAAAGRLARSLLAQGRNLDLGMTQINVRNLRRLGLSVEEAFDPCRNLAGGAAVLVDNYLAARRSTEPQAALRAALSTYNTGDPSRGLRNGYVAAVQRAATQLVPALAAFGPTTSAPDSVRIAPVAIAAEAASAPEASSPPPLDVFARGAPASLVWFTPPLTSSSSSRTERPHAARPGDPS